MKKEAIESDAAPSPAGPYSQGIVAGDFVFVSGQVGMDEEDDIKEGIKEQTRQALENIKSILEAKGLEMGDIVKTTVYISDMDYFGEMNSVYEEFFGEDPPARSCVQTGMLLNFKVEIEATAAF